MELQEAELERTKADMLQSHTSVFVESTERRWQTQLMQCLKLLKLG